MIKMVYLLILLTLGVSCFHQIHAANYTQDGEKWGYVEVRSDAHMFWWLYYTTATDGYMNKPLVIWLQGGPGGSSTGFGNFAEIGPLDEQLKPRPTTWLQEVNLLFIDNPVGTGFSYTTSSSAFTTDNKQIAADLVSLMKGFYQQLPQLKSLPLYIFSESYGGKMTVGFAKALNMAIESGEVSCNFQGFAMGDSWISPMDSVLTWGPYLYATSVVDETGLAAINKSAIQTNEAVNSGQWKEATNLWSQTENVLEANSAGVNFYNILHWGADDRIKRRVASSKSPLERLWARHSYVYANDVLTDLMNGPIRKKLGDVIPPNVTWGGQSEQVFPSLAGDFMKPVIEDVDRMLNTKLKVVVYSGQLDLICDTLGTERWLQKLQWSGLPDYNRASRKPIRDPAMGQPMAFIKQYKNFSFYWILDAGHMVPSDAGTAALEMLRMVTQ